MTQAPEHATTRPAAQRPAPARKARPNGQWKVDGKEPLNHNEEFKSEADPLEVRQRVENIYAHQGFDSIPSDDLHGRFRWLGLYTQRKPGIDGGRTATLEPHELEDRYFMMRVRIDGGALNLTQLRTIAQISTDFARGSADITDRQNIQLHWVEIENVPEIWRRLESVGLITTEACGDCTRVILGSPVAGIALDEIIDPTPIIEELRERYVGDPDLSNLPRKFKSAITGHPSQDVVHEINDISLVGVEHPELGKGYDLWVGGGLSANPRLGERLSVFVTPEQAVEVWLGVVKIFRDYGYRRLRNKARLKFLLKDWGTEKFRQVLQDEYLGYELPDGIAAPKPTTENDHIGVHPQKGGTFFVGVKPTVGRVSDVLLAQVADLAEKHGSERIRLTPHQNILVLDVPGEQVKSLSKALREIGLESRPSEFRRRTIACTGIEYCKLAIVDTKQTAADAIDQLETRLGDISRLKPINLSVNGCPNSCARIQTSDIGLKGQLVMDDDGNQVPGFQVHLGGGLASADREEAGMGRTVRGLKITADGVADYVERVTRQFEKERAGDETFAQWSHRADEEALR